MTTTPAGWYDDGAGMLRYWDGVAWTPHTAPSPAPVAPGATIVVRENPPLPQAAVPDPMAPYPGPSGVPAQWQQPASAPFGYAPHGSMQPVPSTALAPNGVGVAGFVVGLVSVFLPLILGLVGGVVGLILSIVGISRPQSRKGLAIAGLVLSVVAILLLF
jgi:hypothetical protein